MDGDRKAQLESWVDSARAHLASLEAKIAPLVAEQLVAREQLRLLEQLLATLEREIGDFGGATTDADLPTAPQQLEDAAAEILQEAGRPMHVSRIRRELVKRGVSIPGQGLDANVITRLSRSSRFARVARGTYTLARAGEPS